jgi:hypothetical protein
MGSRRIGLARTQALIEGLKRDLNLNGSSVAGIDQKVVSITGAGGTTTLVTADSGKVYLVNAADGTHTFTLPALTAGFNMEIIVTVLSDNDIVVTAPGDNMISSCRQFTAGGAAETHATSTVTTVTLNADTVNAVVGTRIRIYCDGTNYVFIGDCSVHSNSALWVGS